VDDAAEENPGASVGRRRLVRRLFVRRIRRRRRRRAAERVERRAAERVAPAGPADALAAGSRVREVGEAGREVEDVVPRRDALRRGRGGAAARAAARAAAARAA
jgi:hypothetical protein